MKTQALHHWWCTLRAALGDPIAFREVDLAMADLAKDSRMTVKLTCQEQRLTPVLEESEVEETQQQQTQPPLRLRGVPDKTELARSNEFDDEPNFKKSRSA